MQKRIPVAVVVLCKSKGRVVLYKSKGKVVLCQCRG